jgi:carbon monoxide dehydrogenase subunit G
MGQQPDRSIVRLEETRFVDRPLEEVFDYTADFGNIVAWDPGVISSQRTDSGPVEIGSTFEVEVKFGSSAMPMTYEIAEFDRPDRVVLIGRGKSLVAVDDIRFSRADNLTRIDYTADLDFRGWMALVAPLIPGRLRKVGEKALDGLAGVLGG